MNFWPEFIKLKTAVGGNREHYRYEESFGQPMEEQQHITLPAPICAGCSARWSSPSGSVKPRAAPSTAP